MGRVVVEPGEPYPLLVDHLVQAVDVEPRRAVACGRAFIAGSPRRHSLCWILPCSLEVARKDAVPVYLVGEADGEVVVGAQESEGASALRLRERLRPQIRGADRVRVVHDVGAAVLVAADGEREAEREDQGRRGRAALPGAPRSPRGSGRSAAGGSARSGRQPHTRLRSTAKTISPSCQVSREKNSVEEHPRSESYENPTVSAGNVSELVLVSLAAMASPTRQSRSATDRAAAGNRSPTQRNRGLDQLAWRRTQGATGARPRAAQVQRWPSRRRRRAVPGRGSP